MKYATILGLQISSDLTWNNNICEIVKKLNKRLYFLRQLKRSHVMSEKLLLFYLTCIRPVTEYASPVYHHSLPQYLSFDLEGCQRRALRIINPGCSYDEALSMTGLVPLHKRRELLVISFLILSYAILRTSCMYLLTEHSEVRAP